uniref:Integrin beta-1-binding protein 1-like n=1 Tax=Phallusia mammillata TaxID=59560 RepID=A0A6F9DG46_9ASCI|nr:integrin beta-1-binding protein 1-like [Phallusia mammillata]
MLPRTSKTSTDGSDQSVSRSSTHSKSLDSSEELSQSHSSSLSSPGIEARQSTTGSVSSARSSVTDSPGFHQLTSLEFSLKTIGKLVDLEGLAEGPLEVINAIDCAQQEEELPFLPTAGEVCLSISVNGIKICSGVQRGVIERIPLYMVERLVTYEEGIAGNTILAIKTVLHKSGMDDDYIIYVFQCPSKEVGQRISNVFSHILSDVISFPV